MNQRAKAHIGLLMTNLFFAINLSAVKYLTSNQLIGPFGLNLIRVGVSVILFWMLFAFSGNPLRLPHKSDWLRFAGCALTGIAINQLLFLKGLSLTLSIHAALLMLSTPLLITFLAGWLLKEKIGWLKLTGLALGISGASLLIAGRDQSEGSGSLVLLGDLLILINAASYTIYFVMVKPLMHRYAPLEVIRWAFTLGFFMILPFCWSEFKAADWHQFDHTAILCLILIVIGGTFLAYLFNIRGIQILGASVAGSYIYLQPVFAAIIARVFLGEPITLQKTGAAVLIFTGVFLATRKSKEPAEVENIA